MVELSPSGTDLLLGGGCDDFGIEVVPVADSAGVCDAGMSLLAGNSYFDIRPAWSANGLIAYVEESLIALSVVPASGGTPAQILDGTATGGGYLGDVAWSPPGTVIP